MDYPDRHNGRKSCNVNRLRTGKIMPRSEWKMPSGGLSALYIVIVHVNSRYEPLPGRDRQLETAVQELMKEIGAKKSVAKKE